MTRRANMAARFHRAGRAIFVQRMGAVAVTKGAPARRVAINHRAANDATP
jgi:hypothetical protein